MEWFVHGPLCHPALRQVILQRDVDAEAAELPGQAVHWVRGRALSVLQPGAGAAGLLLRGLTSAEQARLAFYGAVTGQTGRIVEVRVAAGQVRAWAGFADAPAGAVWTPGEWADRYGTAAVATAGDIMARYGVDAPEALVPRYDLMLVRGASRTRAVDSAPTALRFAAGEADVQVAALRQPYAHFFAVEEVDVAYRRFDDSLSPVVTRAVFVMGDAVTVLPYDPKRDRVLVIQQFRAGPWGRGDPQPWLIEAIAGRIDPGETPESAARREAVEEAGLVLDALLPVAQYYPSPGAVSEFIYSFVALVDLPDGVEGVFGVEGESEDIRGHLIGLDDLVAMVRSGEAGNAPLILTALWLQRERERLRAASDGGLV